MPKVKTAELVGPALDWAVAKCEESLDRKLTVIRREDYVGYPIEREIEFDSAPKFERYSPSRVWAQAGPIIEREKIELTLDRCNGWFAGCKQMPVTSLHKHQGRGPTPLIASMRCYVESKLGDVVDIPEELMNHEHRP